MERLLACRTEFWAGSALEDESIRALHDPLFFHQLGGFGAVPDDTAVRALARRFDAHEASSPSHAGPGADRTLFTRSLPLG